jgi:hypothetical protein
VLEDGPLWLKNASRWQSGAKHVIPDAFSRAQAHQPKLEDMLLTEEDDADREFVFAVAVANFHDTAETLKMAILATQG